MPDLHTFAHKYRQDRNTALAGAAEKELPLTIDQRGQPGAGLDEDEKPRLVRDLGDKRFLMLRNHGLLTVGRSVAEAFVAMYFFETTCAIQVRAQAGGTSLRRIGQPIIDGAPAQWEKFTQGAGGGLAWPALLRRLDRADPGFRD